MLAYFGTDVDRGKGAVGVDEDGVEGVCGGSYPAAVHVGRGTCRLYISSARLWLSRRTRVRWVEVRGIEKREPLDGDSAQARWFTS